MPSNIVIKLNDKNWGRGKTGGLLKDGDRMCIMGHILTALGRPPGQGKALLWDDDVDAIGDVPYGELMDINDRSDYVGGDARRVQHMNDAMREMAEPIQVVYESESAAA